MKLSVNPFLPVEPDTSDEDEVIWESLLNKRPSGLFYPTAQSSVALSDQKREEVISEVYQFTWERVVEVLKDEGKVMSMPGELIKIDDMDDSYGSLSDFVYGAYWDEEDTVDIFNPEDLRIFLRNDALRCSRVTDDPVEKSYLERETTEIANFFADRIHKVLPVDHSESYVTYAFMNYLLDELKRQRFFRRAPKDSSIRWADLVENFYYVVSDSPQNEEVYNTLGLDQKSFASVLERFNRLGNSKLTLDLLRNYIDDLNWGDKFYLPESLSRKKVVNDGKAGSLLGAIKDFENLGMVKVLRGKGINGFVVRKIAR